MAYGSFGSGFTEGMASGASMADKWIGAYNNAKNRAAYEAAAQEPAEPDFTPDTIAQQYHVDPDTANGVYNQIKADPKNGAKILNALNAVSKGGATGAPATQAQPDTGGVTTAPVPSANISSSPILGDTAGGVGATPPTQATGITPPPVSGPAAASGTLQGVPTIGAGGDLNYPSGRVETSAGALTPPSPAVAPPPAADMGGADAGTSASGGPAMPMPPAAQAPTSAAPISAPPLMPDTGAAPGAPQTGTAPNPFENVVSGVMHREGGYTADDAGKGPTNYGINQSANPDVDVSKLTPDQAKQLYKDRYWDPIGGDKLPSNMQNAAMDAAVNQGVPWTKQALAEANGDLDKFNDLRRARYQQIAKNPDKAKYLPGWLARVDEAGKPPEGSGAVGDPSNNTNIALAPPAQQAQALQTPGGQAKLADDLKSIQQINERMFVDPRTQFAVGADGKITRTGPISDSDRYLRMSRVAVGLGDAATAKAAMDMHITAKAQEAQDYVDNVMKSDLSDDDKIGALTHTTGIKAYKVGDGQYVVPALTGAPDANGQYKRVSINDISNWSKQIATPEGIKALYSWQHQERADALDQQKQDLATKKEGGINVPGSEAWERLYGTYAKFMKQPGTGKEPGNMAEAKPGESFNVQLPGGTYQMASVSNLPGMTADMPGLMRQSEIDKVTKDFVQYQKDDSRFNAKSGNNIITPVANSVPWNPATKQSAQPNDPTAGTFVYQLTGKNPATGKMERYAIGPNGDIQWGKTMSLRSYDQAKAWADKFDQLTHSGAGSSGGKSTPEAPAAEAPEASNAPSALTPPKYAERTPVYGD